MQNFEQLGQELQRRGKTDEIRRLAQSDDGQRLAKLIDPVAVENAARGGDGAALKELLDKVLSTDEGRRLADSVQKLMKD